MFCVLCESVGVVCVARVCVCVCVCGVLNCVLGVESVLNVLGVCMLSVSEKFEVQLVMKNKISFVVVIGHPSSSYE